MTEPRRMIVTHQYPTHFYRVAHVSTEEFCIGCGERTVWCEDTSGGDYYHGESRDCTSCGLVYCWTEGAAREEVTRQLRTGIVEEPRGEPGH